MLGAVSSAPEQKREDQRDPLLSPKERLQPFLINTQYGDCNMSKFKYQCLAAVSFICAGLFLSSEPSEAINFEKSDLIEQKKSIRPKLNWKNEKPKGQKRREDYVETHNRIAKKYGYNSHIISRRVSKQGSTLLERTREFATASKRLAERNARHLEDVKTVGKKVVGVVDDVTEIAVEEGVKSTKTQSILRRLKGKVINRLKNLFN